MAETKHQEETTLHSKRKPDLCREDNEDNPKKAQKLDALDDANNNSLVSQEKKQSLDASEHNSSVAEEKDGKFEADSLAEDEEENYEDEDDDEDEDEDGENGSGEAEADRKGKGIVKDLKGKGKLIAEEEDDEEDDNSDNCSDVSGGESDLSDDPLAEVDLDNILPSRTRRRTVQPGVYIANDLANNDDDSDDSDA